MNKKYKIIKLRSGESLICSMGEIRDKTIVLERPMIFKAIPIPNNPMLFGAEALIMKNWLEFSSDKSVEIPIDHIAALMKPDKLISQCYDMEKEKEDNPELKEEMINKLKEQMENAPPSIPEKLNINFNVPKDMIPEVLDALGIDVDITDEDDIIFEDEEELTDTLPPAPKNNKKKNSKNKSKKTNKKDDSEWGNDWKDWPADPHDYL